MKNRGCLRWSVWLGLLVCVLICIAAGAMVYFQGRAAAFHSRPLVLIHAPIPHDRVHVGDGVLVHATAREDNGLRRIELWADGAFVDARDAAEEPTSLVFAGRWVPTSAGSHTLIVRAFSADGEDGQAAVTVDVLPEETASTPDLEPGAPVPGGETPPGGEPVPPPGGDEPPPPGGDEPLPPDDEPPGPGDDPIWDFPLFEPLRAYPFGAGDPISLRVEFLSLSTTAAYEGLHCYVGYGDVPPAWFPDMDGDPSTDESFTQMGAAPGGGTAWSVEGLSADAAPVFQWRRNLDLPLNVSCVGIVAGGTDSVELGQVEINIPPELWTGMVLSNGVSGSYAFTYRITRHGIWDSGEPLETDFDMTPPTNVHVQQTDSTLRWDYLPRPEEAAIDGFRVYLNGSLQWVEPADARESALPSEWVNPPCGTTYRFDVTAYRSDWGDVQESIPAAAFLEQPAEDCVREIAITFVSLETFELPGDGDAGDRTGDIGPAYGFFWANEQQVTFSGGHLGSGLDLPFGLSRNAAYSISEMAAGGWNFSGEPSLLVTVPENGAFEFGFHIDDEDSGRCNDSDDPGCDDLICEGFSMIYEEESVSGELDRHHEDSITSEDGRCRVTLEWGPAAGSPVGSGLPGWEPAPWLSLEKVTVDEATGQVRLEIRNTGTAAWPARDLNVELQNRLGVAQGVYTWSGFALEAGQRTTLEHPDMRLAAPFDACVLIDPYNAVAEEYERSGGLWHIPVCPSLPDLVITSVGFEPSGGGRIRVAVRNVGEGAVVNRTLALATLLPDGSPLYIAASWPNITLEPGATRVFDLGGVTDSVREQMRGGYSVVVNPDATILESDSANNTMDAAASTRLWIYLYSIFAPSDYRNSVEFHITATVASGSARRQVMDWNLSDIDWGTCDSVDEECSLHFNPDVPTHYSSNWFDIFGDETLTVSVTISSSRPGVPVYWDVETFTAPDWGGGPVFNYTCDYFPTREPGSHSWVLGYHDRAAWGLRFDICRENYEAP